MLLNFLRTDRASLLLPSSPNLFRALPALTTAKRKTLRFHWLQQVIFSRALVIAKCCMAMTLFPMGEISWTVLRTICGYVSIRRFWACGRPASRTNGSLSVSWRYVHILNCIFSVPNLFCSFCWGATTLLLWDLFDLTLHATSSMLIISPDRSLSVNDSKEIAFLNFLLFVEKT